MVAIDPNKPVYYAYCLHITSDPVGDTACQWHTSGQTFNAVMQRANEHVDHYRPLHKDSVRIVKYRLECVDVKALKDIRKWQDA